jgi:hypothetical protein
VILDEIKIPNRPENVSEIKGGGTTENRVRFQPGACPDSLVVIDQDQTGF